MNGGSDRGRRASRRDARGRAEDEPVRLGESLERLADRLGTGSSGALGVVFGRWAHIVGPAVAAHVRPLRLDDRILVVGADHPAWATQLRQLAPQILDRLREACGEEVAPERMEVRVVR